MSKVIFTSRTVESGVKTLYLDEETADVHFVFESNGQTDRIPAHKTLLIAASKVFRAMFNGQWKEKDEVPIPDVFAADFKMFLQYFYLSEVELSMENVEAVMSLSHQYDIGACFNDCATLLEHSLTADNACRIYALAIFYGHEELKTECEIFISLNTENVLKSSGFLEYDRETLSEIIRLDAISCSETTVFNACVEWVKTTSEHDEISKVLVQNHLGNLFYDIRFGSMTMQEFNAICTAHGCLFTDKEQQGITKLIKSKKTQWKSFNGTRRVSPLEKSDELKCNLEADVTPEGHDIEHIETAKFSTNKTLLLKAIVFCEVYAHVFPMEEPYELEDNFTGELTVLEIDPLNTDEKEARVLYVNENVELLSYEHVTILLPKPLTIRRGFKYEIRFEKNENSGNGVTAFFISHEVKIKPDIIVKFDRDPYSRENENHGLVWELRFSDI
ncbi:BTB/POZ domain-containing protein 3-like [Sitodiplosis mosellana]|uniref:BTB/POZ domain-containing protein 3-like n=1 Tax=Sitodiplosis mosellana TaxID=263140 RepID=UPI002444C726|nr:BTB/POZ domain-containing protein 3-like [Sitodiplosis mosellana]